MSYIEPRPGWSAHSKEAMRGASVGLAGLVLESSQGDAKGRCEDAKWLKKCVVREFKELTLGWKAQTYFQIVPSEKLKRKRNNKRKEEAGLAWEKKKRRRGKKRKGVCGMVCGWDHYHEGGWIQALKSPKDIVPPNFRNCGWPLIALIA